MTINIPWQSIGERLRQSIRYYASGLYHEIANKNLFLWAQAIAFKVLVTIVPVVVLATGLIGKVLQSAQPFEQVARFVRDFLPATQSEQIISFLAALYSASSTFTLLGAIGLFLSAWSLFITLRIAVSNAFEQDWHVGRSIIGSYLFDARMVLQVGLLFTLTVGLSVVAQSLESTVLTRWAGINLDWIQRGWQTTIQIVSLLAPFLITTAMFFQLFYFVPRPHPRKRSAFLGSLVTSILWEGAKQGFALYATYVGTFDQYQNGTTEGIAALTNVFGLIIAFVVWVYFSAIVLMVGAVVASLHEHRYRTEQSATTAAPPAVPPGAAPSESPPPTDPLPQTPDDAAAAPHDTERPAPEETAPEETALEETAPEDPASSEPPAPTGSPASSQSS